MNACKYYVSDWADYFCEVTDDACEWHGDGNETNCHIAYDIQRLCRTPDCPKPNTLYPDCFYCDKHYSLLTLNKEEPK